MAFNWVVVPPPECLPCDFRMFLLAGDSRLSRKRFSTLPAARKNAGLVDKERTKFVRLLVTELRLPTSGAGETTRRLGQITRFFSWADSSGQAISLDNATVLLRGFRDVMVASESAHDRHFFKWFFSTIAKALGHDHYSYFPLVFGSSQSEWIIHLPKAIPALHDFRALTRPVTAAMNYYTYTRQTEAYKQSGITKDARTRFVRDLLTAFTAAQIRYRSAAGDVSPFCVFAIWSLFRWLDKNHLPINRKALFRYLSDGTIKPGLTFSA